MIDAIYHQIAVQGFDALEGLEPGDAFGDLVFVKGPIIHDIRKGQVFKDCLFEAPKESCWYRLRYAHGVYADPKDSAVITVASGALVERMVTRFVEHK